MESDIIITIKKISPTKETKFEKWMRLLSASDIVEMERIAKGDQIMEKLVEDIKKDLNNDIETLEDEFF